MAWLGTLIRLVVRQMKANRLLTALQVLGIAAFGFTLWAWGRERALMQKQLDEYKNRPPLVVTITVPRRDTVIVHREIPTTQDSVGTRHATFRDSTFAGVISGEVTAPPTGPLGIAYQILRPPFNPTFTLTNDSAIVAWQDERAAVAYTPAPPPPPVVINQRLPLVGTTYSVGTTAGLDAYRLTAGVALRPLSGISLTAELEQHVDIGARLERPRLYFGIRIER